MNVSRDEMKNIAKQILEKESVRVSKDHATLITFSGDLGAGKTTLIQEIAKELAIKEVLQSPTFTIYKTYSISQNSESSPHPEPLSTSVEKGVGSYPWKYLVHGDMYRLDHSDEMKLLGWDQLISDPENLVCIEWPEKIADIIPEWAARVTLEHQQDSDTRNVVLSS